MLNRDGREPSHDASTLHGRIVETRYYDPSTRDYEIRLDIFEPESCGDGVDNDLDTLADCDDADCTDASSCNP